MIQANELRPGNWVFSLSGTPGKVVQTTIYKIPITPPIPLTTEILKQCGFKQDGKFFELDDVIILGFGDFYYYYYNCTKDSRTELKHVHQLQNLYFILTGKELEISL